MNREESQALAEGLADYEEELFGDGDGDGDGAVAGRENLTPENLVEAGIMPRQFLSARELVDRFGDRDVQPRLCVDCGQGFLWHRYSYQKHGLRHPPKRCPACQDRRQGRPTIAVRREEKWVSPPCEVVSLPREGHWEWCVAGGHKDRTYRQIIVGGEGSRLDLFASDFIEIGATVLVRERAVWHERADDPESGWEERQYLLLHPTSKPAAARLVWTEVPEPTLPGRVLRAWEVELFPDLHTGQMLVTC